MELAKDDILAQLDRIVADKAFSRSKVNVRLLAFLVKATIDEQDIKEVTIGTEFFGAKYDPFKSDSQVRVYVYHLRKKLDEYYRNSAGPNEIVFHIAKGQYQVQFEASRQANEGLKSPYRWAYLPAVILVILGIATTYPYPKPTHDFWQSLMQNELPTTVVFGDYFTMEGPIGTGGDGVIRDYEINSEQELAAFLAQHPEQAKHLRASRHHYFNWSAPYCSRMMTAFWGKHDYPFEMTQISEWSVSQLGKENVVYFGQSKTMGVLRNILVEVFPQYTFQSQVISRQDPVTGEPTIYKDVVTYDDKMVDYTIVANISMPTGNELRFFLSDQDCGAISALQYFTQRDSVEAFYQRHGISKEEDFIALFKVTGWLRKSYEMEFVLLDRR